MVNLKNYNVVLAHFVLILTVLLSTGCTTQKLRVSRIEGKEIAISENHGENEQIAAFIKPYRDHINADLSTVLAYSPQTLDKSGEWQSAIGNLFADVALQLGNPVFMSREQKSIDLCLLNHGGIRSIINKGDVTARTAYEIMPFENNLIVVALKGEQLYEIANFIIAERKPHPLSGMTFTIGSDNMAKNIMVRNQPVDINKIYYVATNDYLANGGDNMNFFKKGTARYDLDYKLRNVLIDYFKQADTIPLIKDKRIEKE